MGFAGSHGEIHIENDNSWVSCPGKPGHSISLIQAQARSGDDNMSTGCTAHDVTLLASNIVDHLGPYNGILMGLCGFS